MGSLFSTDVPECFGHAPSHRRAKGFPCVLTKGAGCLCPADVSDDETVCPTGVMALTFPSACPVGRKEEKLSFVVIIILYYLKDYFSM